MPNFCYKARDLSGKIVSGSIALPDEKTAREHLRVRELFVTSIQLEAATNTRKVPLLLRRVKLPELVIFSRQFASMIKAGVPIMQTLGCLAEQTESRVLAG